MGEQIARTGKRVVVITGSRYWQHADYIHQILKGADHLIVGDCPTGADAMALRYAQHLWDNGLEWHRYRADWEKFGRRAGPERNRRIAEAAHVALSHEGHSVEAHAFLCRDYINKGTLSCIELLKAFYDGPITEHWDHE